MHVWASFTNVMQTFFDFFHWLLEQKPCYSNGGNLVISKESALISTLPLRKQWFAFVLKLSKLLIATCTSVLNLEIAHSALRFDLGTTLTYIYAVSWHHMHCTYA